MAELLTVIVVVAMQSALTLPLFEGVLPAYRLNAATSEVFGGLQWTRQLTRAVPS